jgi:hypothetical protein
VTPCRICLDFEVCKRVNQLLIGRMPARKIAAEFPGRFSYKSVERHRRKCAARRIARAWERRDALLQIDGESLLVDLAGLKNRLQSTLVAVDPKADLQAFASVAREHRMAVEALGSMLRLAEGGRRLSEISINVVYGSQPRVDLPAPPPTPYRIVREQAPPALAGPAVEVEVVREDPPPEPEPPPQRRLPPPPTSAVVLQSDDRAGMMPAGWSDWLHGGKRL